MFVEFITSDKTISYIIIYHLITFLIYIFFDDYIVYILKGKKGAKVAAKVIEIESVFQREPDATIFEYGNRLLILPYDPNDKIGDVKTLYLNGEYVTRKRIGLQRNNAKFALLFAVCLFFFLRYVIKNWSGPKDIIIWVVLLFAVVIDIYTYPLLYKIHIKRYKEKLGWHIN